MKRIVGLYMLRTGVRVSVILLFSCLCVFPVWAEPATDKHARIAVLTNHGYQEAVDRWTPTATYLTAEIPGWSFAIVPLDPEVFESAIDRGDVDFAISCPSLYVKLKALYDVHRIVTMKTPYTHGSYHFFASVIFCRSDNAIETFGDLKGKRLMAMHGKSCTTWHVACIEFLRHGLKAPRDFGETRFAAEPADVVQTVRTRAADVGIVRSDMYDQLEATGDIRPAEFRVLHDSDEPHDDVPFSHSTALYPERVVAQLKDTPDALAEQVTTALLRMSADDVPAKAARCSGWTIPHNYEALRDGLKALRVSPYEEFGKVTLSHVFAQYRLWIISIILLVLLVFASLGLTVVQGRRLNRVKRAVLERQIVETSDRAQKALGETIHGTLAQQLTAIRLFAETLHEQDTGDNPRTSRSIRLICELAREAVGKSKDIASSLYPAVLSQCGLAAAIEDYLAAMRTTFGIQYTLRLMDGLETVEPKASLHLYRIMQEAVHNAIKHGKAEHVLVAIEARGNSHRLIVENNGQGIGTEEVRHHGLGLQIMRYRARAIGGTLTLTRPYVRGARVTCTFDLTRVARHRDNKRLTGVAAGKGPHGTNIDRG